MLLSGASGVVYAGVFARDELTSPQCKAGDCRLTRSLVSCKIKHHTIAFIAIFAWQWSIDLKWNLVRLVNSQSLARADYIFIFIFKFHKMFIFSVIKPMPLNGLNSRWTFNLHYKLLSCWSSYNIYFLSIHTYHYWLCCSKMPSRYSSN